MEEIRRPKPSLSDVLPKASSPQSRTPKPAARVEVVEDRPAPSRRSGSSFGKKLFFWLVIIIIIGGPLVFYTSRAFTRVKVTVEQRNVDIVLDETVIAKRIPLTASSTGEIGFQMMTLESTETQAVDASGTEKVAEKARGEIIIYNDFNAEPQQLVINTRFESPAGKIYHLTTPVSVPGQKMVDGKLTPGSVSATVVADAAGESYNSAPTDFKIPGFKGSPRYDKFYARSKTPLAGGFVGERASVAVADRERVSRELESVLKDRLLKEAATSVPPGFILFGEGAFFDFETLAANAASGGTTNLTVKGAFNGIMFDRLELSRYLAGSKIQDLGTSPVSILEPEKLTFDLLSAETFDTKLTQTIRFKLTGPAKVVCIYDEKQLLSDLLGKKRNDYQKIFTQYPSITRATAEFTPPWANQFPDTTDRIAIVDAL